MDTPVPPPAQRRTFLWLMAAGLGGLLTAAAGWPLLRFLSPSGGAGEGEKVVLKRADVPMGSAHFFQFRGKPAVALQPRPGEYLALSAVCTHLGCVVQWQEGKGEFLCPCHAGRFSVTGAVLGGPPPRPLEPLPIAVNGDQLLIG